MSLLLLFLLLLFTDEALVTASNHFHETLAAGDYKSFCEMKSNTAVSEADKHVRQNNKKNENDDNNNLL